MELWNWITGLFDSGGGIAGNSSPPHTDINPATGLPKVGGIDSIDMVGNPFGTNQDHWHSHDGIPGHSSHDGRFDSW